MTSCSLHVLVMFGFCLYPLCNAALRSVSEIRYRFTPCEATGNEGPSHETCETYYNSINSPITRNRQFFEIRDYDGAQGFRVPRDGLYNITVVGASGGRGICNIQGGGLGVSIKVQAQLTRDIELMIMVGHKGTGPCDVIPNTDPVYNEFCTSLPTTSENASFCNTTWMLRTSNYHSHFSITFGGGSGGGASMVRARHRSNEQFDGLPIVISGGGGGSPARFYYDIIDVLNVDSILPDDTDYAQFMNGKTTNNSSYNIPGTRGVRAENTRPDPFIAGAGGGYRAPTDFTLMDGTSLSDSMIFAIGGIDCVQIQRQAVSNTSAYPFYGTVGGFGGGGGGCAEGGGGGGYTGGSVLQEGVTVPGGGGFSTVAVGNITNIEPTIVSFLSGNNSGDGYVEIIEADCGCVHECLICPGGQRYECTCPEEASLGPNLNDCYVGSEISVDGTSFFDYELLEFPNSVYLFSIQADFEFDSENQEDRCQLLFTEENFRVVLVSNVVSAAAGSANMLALLNSSPNGMDISLVTNYTDFLTEAVLVTGAIVVGTGECSVDSIFANISIRESMEDVLTTESPISLNVVQGVASLLQPTLPSETSPTEQETTTPTQHAPTTQETDTTENTTVGHTVIDPRSAALSSGQLIGIVIGGIVVLIVAVSMAVFLVTYVRFHHTHSKGTSLQVDSEPDGHGQIAACTFPLTSMNDYVSGEGIRSLSLSVTSKHVEELPPDMMICSENLKLGKMVGEGEFGSVYKAQLRIRKSQPLVLVAVKTLKGFFNQKHVDEMLKESKKMCNLNHPNVQTLIGVCIDGGPTPYIVMPFMMNGSLLNFLRKNKDTLLLKEGSEEYEVNPVAKRLTEMCLQITKGMEYLATNNIIHRDLAARNCMIDDKHVICVSDFGLSENTYSKTYIRQEDHKNMLLPMKWVAPESFNFGIFSEKTDVWAFGVTCWEVFSAGKIPYPGINAQSLPHLIDSGHRMDKPDNAACTDAIYGVMTQCWHAEAEERPTFSELVQTIESDLVSRADYLVLGNTDADALTIAQDQELNASDNVIARIDIVF